MPGINALTANSSTYVGICQCFNVGIEFLILCLLCIRMYIAMHTCMCVFNRIHVYNIFSQIDRCVSGWFRSMSQELSFNWQLNWKSFRYELVLFFFLSHSSVSHLHSSTTSSFDCSSFHSEIFNWHTKLQRHWTN